MVIQSHSDLSQFAPANRFAGAGEVGVVRFSTVSKRQREQTETASYFLASPASADASAGASWERPESEFAQANSLSG